MDYEFKTSLDDVVRWFFTVNSGQEHETGR